MTSKSSVADPQEAVDVEDVDVQPKGCGHWVSRHKWLLFGVIAATTVVVVLAAVLIPVGLTVGFGGKSHPQQQEFPTVPGPLTLLVSYLDISVDVMDRVPAGLRPFVQNLRLDSSAIQLLSADTERVLREVYKYLKADPDLIFLVRDVFLSIPTNGLANDTSRLLTSSVLDDARNALDQTTGRRLTQMINPNDPMLRYQWHLLNNQTYSSNAEGAWKITAGQPDLVVAVTDTGVDYGHPDLQGNMWYNRNEIPNDGIDNDKNGFVDDYWGWNFGSNNKDPMDTDGHGTNVAGIVAAVSNNRLGVSSAAYNARIMALRLTDSSGYLSLGNAMSAFNYALKNGAHIVVCSWGPGWYSYNQAPPTAPAAKWESDLTKAYTLAIQPLEQAGVLVVAAAGNTNMNLDPLKSLGYFYGPCLINTTNVVCVAANDRASPGAKTSFSNYGTSTVHIHAPGKTICALTCRGCYYGDNYACYDGTSQATPLTAAGLALTTVALGTNYLSQTFRARDLLFATATPGAYYSIVPARINITAAVLTAFSSQSIKPMAASVASAVIASGMSDAYYLNPTGQAVSVAGLKLLDTSFRPTPFPVGSYKQAGSTVLLDISATVVLDTAGSWALRIVTDRNFTCSLGGVVMSFTASSSTFTTTFNLADAGSYAFDLLVASPSGRIDVTWRRPASTTFVVLTSFFGFTNTSLAAQTTLTSAPTASGFLVKYSRSSTAVARSTISSLNTSTAALPLLAATDDLDFEDPGTWGRFLFPDNSALAAFGTVETTLQLPPLGNSGYSFQMSCTVCQLLINGMVVLDIWENILKTSGCVTFPAGGAYSLLIKFGENSLPTADHVLQWSSCLPGQATSALTFTSLASSTSSYLLWNPTQQLTGYQQGMHCDVSIAPADTSAPPTFKTLQPTCGTHLDNFCVKPFNMTLDDMIPGLAARYPRSSGAMFSARCWTFWNDTAVGAMAAWSATGTAALQIAGVQVTASQPLSWAPGSYFRLLQLDLSRLAADAQFGVTLAGVPIQLDPTEMYLPLLPFAGSTSLVGTPGHYSTTWNFVSTDVANVVPYMVTNRAATGGLMRRTDRALDYWNATYTGVTSGVQTYAWMRSFLNITVASTYTHLIREWGNQGILAVLDGVTMKNSPQWSRRYNVQATYQTSVYLLPGLYSFDMISKTTNPSHYWGIQRLTPVSTPLTPTYVTQSKSNAQD